MLASAEANVGTENLRSYFSALANLLSETAVTAHDQSHLDFGGAVSTVITRARATHAAGNKLIFIGNGGSAAIASHMATDYSKNGGIRALALNDSSMLTCLGNDLGYDRVFAQQIELHARRGDLLIAISSSGRSPNILSAVDAAATAGCGVITLSGFDPDNPLRQKGDINFYLASDRYGFVEIGHLTICHAILDFLCGLPAPSVAAAAHAAAR
jgi:D-sedoheptulose 7-phosphate isomerase